MQFKVGWLELMMLVNDRDVTAVGSKIKIILDMEYIHLDPTYHDHKKLIRTFHRA
jgi:hypothetical protein